MAASLLDSEENMRYLLWYYLIMTGIGFIIMGEDKRRAVKGKWRIKEKTLFIAALLGGALGTTLGMYCFRHKTKHAAFRFGLPVLFLMHLLLLIVLISR